MADARARGRRERKKTGEKGGSMLLRHPGLCHKRTGKDCCDIIICAAFEVLCMAACVCICGCLLPAIEIAREQESSKERHVGAYLRKEARRKGAKTKFVRAGTRAGKSSSE